MKESAYYYLCYLASKRLSTQQLRPEIAGLSLRSDLTVALDSRNPELHTKIVRLIREDGTQRARIPNDKDTIRTESNLSFRVLSAVLASIGLDAAVYDEQRDLIDAELVAVRNRIVHGENETIALTEWVELRDAVLVLMRGIADQIQNSAIEQTYLAWRA